MRYLAIDLGDKRTGLALGDDVTRVVTPLDVLEVPRATGDGAALLEALVKAAQAHLGPPRADVRLVLGLPLNMDGREGPRAALARDFGLRLASRTGYTVAYHDERLSSAKADWTMARSGLTRGQKKARRDARAAAAILADYLERSGPDSDRAAEDA